MRKAKKSVVAKSPPKRQQIYRHIKLTNDHYSLIRELFLGGTTSRTSAAEIVNRLEPGQSEITTLSPYAFNQLRKTCKLELKVGLFIVPNATGIAPVRATLVQRLA